MSDSPWLPNADLAQWLQTALAYGAAIGAGIAAALGWVVLGPIRAIKREVAAMQKHCNDCPAQMIASRTVAIDGVRKELHDEIRDLRNHFDSSMDAQSAELRAGLQQLQHNIITALGVKAARGEAD